MTQCSLSPKEVKDGMEAGQGEIKAAIAGLQRTQLLMKSRDKKLCIFLSQVLRACIHVGEYHLFDNESPEQLEEMIKWRSHCVLQGKSEGSGVSPAS